ncbi:hypothetical protein CWC45_12365 [Neisseria sp. N177_16]|nr:hypothetical protein CWC45_12365 [Neisseria sp. N177_16]
MFAATFSDGLSGAYKTIIVMAGKRLLKYHYQGKTKLLLQSVCPQRADCKSIFYILGNSIC